MKIIKLLFILIILSLIFYLPVLAVDSTDSAVTDDQVTEKIKERLEQVAGTDIEAVKNEVTTKLYCAVGLIEKITSESLTIKTLSGSQEGKIASPAALLMIPKSGSRKDIKASDISANQFIIAMGPKQNEILIIKRAIVMDEAPALVKHNIVSGKVTEIDESKITIKKNGDTAQLSIDKSTKLKINGIKSPTTEDIQVDDWLTAIYLPDKNDKIGLVKAVLIIPGKANPQSLENEVQEENTATSSASPKSSPKPSASPIE